MQGWGTFFAKGSWHIVILGMILLLALALRLYGIGGTFVSSDDAEVAWNVSRYYPRDWQSFVDFSSGALEASPFWLLVLPHGFLNTTIALIFVSIYSFLNFEVTEAAWHFPFALLGTASVLTSYALVRLIADKRAAVMAALFIAVSPFHIAYSRTSGISHHMLAYLFQTLSLFLFIRIFAGARRPRDEWAASLSLALGITTDLGFPMTIATIGCSGLICHYQTQGKLTNAFRQLLADLRRWRLIMPVLLSTELVLLEFFIPLFFFGIPLGILGGVFLSEKDYGLHFGQYFGTMVFLTNPVIWLVIVPFLFFAIRYFRPLNRKAVLLLWAVLYSVPFLMITRVRLVTYYITIVGAVLLVTSVVLFDLPFLKKTPRITALGVIVGLFVAVALLMTTLSMIWHVPVPRLLAHRPDQGSIRDENGAKAAGWWIRKMIPGARYVYTDAYGGGGLEPPVAWYYFHRPIFALFDATGEEALALLDANRDQIDALVIRSDNVRSLEIRNYPEFLLAVEIVSQEQPLLYIFVRNWSSPPVRLDTAQVNQLYDREFSQLDKIVDMSSFR